MLPDPLQQCGYGTRVARLGGAHPVVVTATETAPGRLESLRDLVGPPGRIDARRLGGLEHLLAMLVHSHQEMDRLAAQAMPARDDVGTDLLQRVPQVRVAVGIVDCSGEVVRSLHRVKSFAAWPISSRSATTGMLRLPCSSLLSSTRSR